MNSLIVFGASYLVALCPIMVAYVLWKASPRQRRVLLLRIAIVTILGIAMAKTGGALYNEPRPFVLLHATPLVAHGADSGFPSDHSLVAFGCAFLILPYSVPLAGATFLIAALVGIARVASLLHSPLDIGASILFAGVANAVAWFATRSRGA
jgi:undecaprenyl-diphosphatase